MITLTDNGKKKKKRKVRFEAVGRFVSGSWEMKQIMNVVNI